MSEHTEQANLFEWAALQTNVMPELEWLYAVPNGGKRHIAVAAKMKAEGVKAGVPDVVLPAARGGYFGLYIEMKVDGRKPSKSQKKWLKYLISAGYHAVVCNGFYEAKDMLVWYLAQKRTVGLVREMGRPSWKNLSDDIIEERRELWEKMANE